MSSIGQNLQPFAGSKWVKNFLVGQKLQTNKQTIDVNNEVERMQNALKKHLHLIPLSSEWYLVVNSYMYCHYDIGHSSHW